MITYHDENMIRKKAKEERNPEKKKKKDEVDIE
jgi:hypothetical protein